MLQSINLSPVEELLTDVVSPEKLAQTMDDIYYDYVYALVWLLSRTNSKGFVLDDSTVDYIWYLRKLRDTFRACAVAK